MDPNTTEVTQTNEPKAAPPQSLHDEMLKSVTEQYGKAAAEESAAAETPAAEETPKADPDGSGAKPAETKPDESERFEVTPEQLADKKFWGSLDKAGWERMERDYPVATAHVKAAQAAATRIVNEARKEAPKPAEERSDAKPALSPELQQAFRKMQSLDESEALEGFREMQRITLRESLPEFGLDPDRARVERDAEAAYSIASKAMPEIDAIDSKTLDAAVESDPFLMQMLAVAIEVPDEAKRLSAIATVMRQAATNVLSKQKAETDAKAAADALKAKEKADKQAKLRANASVASSTVVESPSGGARQGEETPEQYVNRLYREAAAREGATA